MNSTSRTKEGNSRRKFIEKNLRNEFDKFSQFGYYSEDDFYKILYKKIYRGNLPMRANMAVALYEYLLEEYAIKKTDKFDCFFRRQFPFILEVIISVQYYHNQILDDKAGVNTPTTINSNLIAGNLLKDQLYRYLENVNLPAKHISQLTHCVRTIFEAVDIGQYIEKNHNTYDAFCNDDLRHPFEKWVDAQINKNVIANVVHTTSFFVEEKYQRFTQIYAERIYLISSILYLKALEFIMDLLGVSDIENNHMKEYISYFGICLQLVSENTDFVPSNFKESTAGKCFNDALSDLKNKNLTLPIFVHLCRNPSGKTAHFLEEMKRSEFGRLCLMPEQEKDIYNEILDSLSIYHAMKIPKLLKEKAIKYLNEHNSNYNTLLSIIKIVDNNRFYKHFYNQEEQYKKYKKERR